MRKMSPLLSCLLVLIFLCSTAAIVFAQPEDSIWVSSVDPVPPDTTVTVDVRLKLTQPVVGFVVPLIFRNENNLEIELDSIRWSDWVWHSDPGFVGDSVNNVDKWMYAYALWLLGDFPEGDGTLFTMFFTTSPYWDPDRPVVIDTVTKQGPDEPTQLVFFDTTLPADTVVVGFVPGFLGPGFIPDVGDVNGDRNVSLPDVVYLVNYIFRGGPPPFYGLWVGDVNCDDKVDVVDAVYLINYLLKGGPPPGDPDNDGVPDC